MSILLQWVLCIAIGLAAASYLAFKYFVHQPLPGGACGKCEGCAANSQLELLARQDHGGSNTPRRPGG